MISKVIAIDGPSGSGKSTIAKLIAAKLGLVYLDTGAMFRGLGYILDQKNIDAENVSDIEECLQNIKLEYGIDEDTLIKIDGLNLTKIIREHKVSELASIYSQVPEVRSFLKKKQQEIGNARPSILEGRDIGTVIFPKAALKFFLTANPEVRAKRRLTQLIEKDQNNQGKYSVKSILKDIEERDLKDSTRAEAPLVQASDAMAVDTSSLGIDQVVDLIVAEYQKKKDLF